MSISGRINVDIVYHDKDLATNSLKVVEAESSETHETGKVAIVRGTASTSHITIQHNNTGYTDAAGHPVTFSQITRIALKSSRKMTLEDNQGDTIILSSGDQLACSQIEANSNVKLTPKYTSGTAAFTVFLYGT